MTCCGWGREKSQRAHCYFSLGRCELFQQQQSTECAERVGLLLLGYSVGGLWVAVEKEELHNGLKVHIPTWVLKHR